MLLMLMIKCLAALTCASDSPTAADVGDLTRDIFVHPYYRDGDNHEDDANDMIKVILPRISLSTHLICEDGERE